MKTDDFSPTKPMPGDNLYGDKRKGIMEYGLKGKRVGGGGKMEINERKKGKMKGKPTENRKHQSHKRKKERKGGRLK